MEYRLFTAPDFRTAEWPGGKTTELFIFPPEGDYRSRSFAWRLSSATVESETSEFTALPDITRHLMLLRGSMALSHGGRPAIRLAPFEPVCFDGGVPTRSRDAAEDFNLMTAPGFSGRIACLTLGPEKAALCPAEGQGSAAAVTECLYAAEDGFTALYKNAERSVPRGGLLVFRRAAKDAAPVLLWASGPSHVARATVWETPGLKVQS